MGKGFWLSGVGVVHYCTLSLSDIWVARQIANGQYKDYQGGQLTRVGGSKAEAPMHASGRLATAGDDAAMSGHQGEEGGLVQCRPLPSFGRYYTTITL